MLRGITQSSKILKHGIKVNIPSIDHVVRSFSAKSAKEATRNFAVNNRGLYKTGKSPFEEVTPEGVTKSKMTELVTELKNLIHVRGPLSMAEWMQYCLGHPQHGYYMQRDAIGKGGDFITNPEISSIYGEIVCVWCVTTWMNMGSPKDLQLIELGPGRGTLMKDILTAAENFPDFYNAIRVHFVENSGFMRDLQANALAVTLDKAVFDLSNSHQHAAQKVATKTLEKVQKAKEVLQTKKGDAEGLLAEETQSILSEASEAIEKELDTQLTHLSSGVMDPEYCSVIHGFQDTDEDIRAIMTRPRVFGESARQVTFNKDKCKTSLPVTWNWSLQEIPSNAPCIILAHEFFDALPVNQFQFTSKGWREILVDIDNGAGPHHFKYVLSSDSTPMTQVFVNPISVFGAPVNTLTIETNNNTTPTPQIIGSAAEAMPSLVNQMHQDSPHFTQGSAPNVLFSKDTTTHNAFPGIMTPSGQLYTGTQTIDPVKANSTSSTTGTGNTGASTETTVDPLQMFKNTAQLTAEVESKNMSEKKKLDAFKKPNKVGDTYEVSPIALAWGEQIAVRLMKSGGAALLIDYGDNDTGFMEPDNIYMYSSAKYQRVYRDLSIQGLKGHKHADVLEEPGYVDLSAHVNFGALSAVARRTAKQMSLLLNLPDGTPEKTRALKLLYGPNQQDKDLVASKNTQLHNIHAYSAITQSEFLQKLGIEARFENLLQKCTSQEQADALFQAVNRLVDPAQMGELFKVMAITSKDVKIPVGWNAFSEVQDTMNDPTNDTETK